MHMASRMRRLLTSRPMWKRLHRMVALMPTSRRTTALLLRCAAPVLMCSVIHSSSMCLLEGEKFCLPS